MRKLIVIGGGSFQGKSLIALNIAQKLKIPLIVSSDTIRNVLRALHPRTSYLSTSTYLMSADDLKKQMEEVSRVLLKTLETWNRRGEDVIIEGMHLSPEFIETVCCEPNALVFCIDNKLPLDEKLVHKAMTRHRVEYLNSVTGEVTYGELEPNSPTLTRYVRHSERIGEIHREIVNCFSQRSLPVIEFDDMNAALMKVGALVDSWLKRRTADTR